jgi:hypothetical protein
MRQQWWKQAVFQADTRPRVLTQDEIQVCSAGITLVMKSSMPACLHCSLSTCTNSKHLALAVYMCTQILQDLQQPKPRCQSGVCRGGGSIPAGCRQTQRLSVGGHLGRTSAG